MVKIIDEQCIGCGLCESIYPEIFEVKNFKAIVKKNTKDKLGDIDCPVDAIIFN